ncbi:CRE-PRMT-6 protein [Aphelenchoides avenae]|nr:CRE-PRMT-6 protein [Aphelenchus avenae]
MPHFPAAAFLASQKRWIGKECIVLPTISAAVGQTLQGKRVLDVGCGNGSMCSEYLEMGAREVVGIDAHPEMIRQCLLHCKGDARLSFEQGSISEMQYDAEFDVVMAIFVLQFCESVRDLQKTLRMAAKALKPGGWLFGYVPNGVADVNPIQAEGVKLGNVKSSGALVMRIQL